MIKNTKIWFWVVIIASICIILFNAYKNSFTKKYIIEGNVLDDLKDLGNDITGGVNDITNQLKNTGDDLVNKINSGAASATDIGSFLVKSINTTTDQFKNDTNKIANASRTKIIDLGNTLQTLFPPLDFDLFQKVVDSINTLSSSLTNISDQLNNIHT